MWKRLVLAVCGLLLAASLPVAWSVVPASAQTGSFTFGASGDFGANDGTGAVLNAVAGAGTDFFMAVGDLSYSQVTPESAWCNFVTSRFGANYPFELLAGNHEDDGPDGQIANFAACLPDRIGGLTGSYGKEYYFDYPVSAPLARMIDISPNLAFPGEGTYTYTAGNAHYTWLANAIDSARAAGIPWVIVSMHENCLKAGSTACEIGTDLENLLLGRKVDLILQGHDHTYQRSKQLALSAACPTVTNTAFDADCVVNDGSSGAYDKGAGLVQVISGVGGEAAVSSAGTDPDAKYFAKVMDANRSFGFTKFQVTATQLSAQFVAATGSFSDSFTIGTPSGNQTPVALSANLATPQNTALPVTLQGTDGNDCELSFSIVTPPAHGSLPSLADQTCAPGSPNRDSATGTYTPDPGFVGTDSFTFKVNDGTIDSNTATVTVAVGTPPGISFRAGSSAQNPTSTSLTIGRPAGVVPGDVMVAGVGIRGTPAVTPPPGWTFIRTDAAGTYTTQVLYYRVVTASEPASYTWTFSASVPAAGGIEDYQGVNTAVPINVSGATAQINNTTSIAAPSVTTTVPAARVVGFFSIGGGNSITPPAGMTERSEASSTAGSSHVTWEGSDFTQTAAGATGPRTATAASPHPNVGALVALTPGAPPANQAPTATGASVSTARDTALPVTLQASDPDNCELSFPVVSQPAHGTVSVPSPQPCAAGTPNQDSATVMYTPTAGYTGPDSFSFKANDGTVDSNTATVAITVTPPPPPVNVAPTALGATPTTPAGTALPVTLQATDPDNCPLIFSVVTPPAHGTLDPSSDPDCVPGSPNSDSVVMTYTPAPDFNGTDSFTFKANDGTSDSNTATVSVTVGTPPAAITFRSASSAQNPTGATLSISQPAGVVPGDVLVAGIGIRGAPTVTPPAGWTLIRRDQAGTYTTQALYSRVVTA
ncbi:MAG TPA: Ig-like domain-containing protein, partial [Acidimicrobiia bacterium]